MAGFYERSIEQNKKHSFACKGKSGKWKRNKKQNKLMSDKLKGRIFTKKHLSKLKEALKRRWEFGDLKDRVSLERRKEMERISLIPKEHRLSRKKEKNGNWKGGLTSQNKLIRESPKYISWRKAVFQRDNYTCQMPECRIRGVYLEVHHIKMFEKYPELRFDANNGITLCKECHNKTKWREKKFEKLFIDIAQKLNNWSFAEAIKNLNNK